MFKRVTHRCARCGRLRVAAGGPRHGLQRLSRRLHDERLLRRLPPGIGRHPRPSTHSGPRPRTPSGPDGQGARLPYGSSCGGCHASNYAPSKVVPTPTATDSSHRCRRRGRCDERDAATRARLRPMATPPLLGERSSAAPRATTARTHRQPRSTASTRTTRRTWLRSPTWPTRRSAASATRATRTRSTRTPVATVPYVDARRRRHARSRTRARRRCCSRSTRSATRCSARPTTLGSRRSRAPS